MGYFLYKHTTPNGKAYIGITKLLPRNRWRNGEGYIGCHRFYNAIKKYGWENIKHEILFKNLTKEVAEQKEIEMIKRLKTTNDKHGYNIQSGGNCLGTQSKETKLKISVANKGKKRSKEFCERMSQINKGNQTWRGRKHKKESMLKMSGPRKSMQGKNNPKARKVNQFDLQGEYLATYESVSIAEKAVSAGEHTCNIAKCCRGVYKTSYGYIWKYDM